MMKINPVHNMEQYKEQKENKDIISNKHNSYVTQTTITTIDSTLINNTLSVTVV